MAKQFLLLVAAITAAICLSGSTQALPNPPVSSRVGLKDFVTTEERVRSHDYPAESHVVETEDGYVLNLFRIPYSHNLMNAQHRRPVVLLQHGLFSDSDCWIANGPDHSIAYLLADAGFDVWMGNARGNIYSRTNSKVSINSPKFWHFSWHEIGSIDIAAMIDYILENTGEEALHYVGHSQGTTVYLVLMSLRPEYNHKIKTAHMLAPCAFFGHGTSFVFKLLSPLVGQPGGIWNSLLQDMELTPHNELVNRIIDTACGENQPALGDRCRNMFLWFAGDNSYQNTNITGLQVLLETHPAGSSSNQGIHYIQLYNSHEFRQYDFGAKRNKQLYGTDTPPDYDLDKITATTYLYSSQNDALCPPADVDTLVSKMPQLAGDYRVPDASWNHLDFIVANRMKSEINDRIVEIVVDYEK